MSHIDMEGNNADSRHDDPIHNQSYTGRTIINCLNGELWFDDQGNTKFKPHRADSYLQHCLDVLYDPDATYPLFKKAVMEIFAQSEQPEEMFRHFMELGGYICQPWRRLPIIVLLYGGGNNGKSSLVKIIQKVLGQKMVIHG